MLFSSMSKQQQTQLPIQEQHFPEIVQQFLEKYCVSGSGLYVVDKTLFPKFRVFWLQTTQQAEHPALLGQFRVELTRRGYRSNGAKQPRWYGLSLRKRPKRKKPGRKAKL